MLIGNKSDETEKREVTKEEELNMSFLEVSAFTGDKIKEIFF